MKEKEKEKEKSGMVVEEALRQNPFNFTLSPPHPLLPTHHTLGYIYIYI